MIARVVSGGQTGVDRAGLDVALELGIGCGGWCPRGRRAEDGPIPQKYPLKQTPGAAYIDRTRLNVRDSDATLVLTRGRPTGGTRRTVEHAERLGRPVLVIDLDLWDGRDPQPVAEVGRWIVDYRIATLNVAGPRESTIPGIHDDAAAFLRRLLAVETIP